MDDRPAAVQRPAWRFVAARDTPQEEPVLLKLQAFVVSAQQRAVQVSEVLQRECEPGPRPMNEGQDNGVGKFQEFVDHEGPKRYDERKLLEVSAIKKACQDS